MLRRLTVAEIIQFLGDPTPHIGSDGTIGPAWEAQIITRASLPAQLPLSWNRTAKVSQFKCHKRLAKVFQAALTALYNNPEVWNTIGDFGGCYEFRMKRRIRPRRDFGLERLSLHSWGAAIDLDVSDNPQGRTPRIHPDLPVIMEAWGFVWGGYFPSPQIDGMHFEAAPEAFAVAERLA